VPILERNTKTSTEAAKPGRISPGRMTGIGSIEGIPGTARKKIHRRIVLMSARFVPEIAGDLP